MSNKIVCIVVVGVPYIGVQGWIQKNATLFATMLRRFTLMLNGMWESTKVSHHVGPALRIRWGLRRTRVHARK
ncbi:transmembrane protein, putative [Medicago truncatula]|uniref:Transmembrane protein, putative n=1 Tax=Medicago truncatula TaxID=3880 RepID=G7K2C9_MEDTR|nr:transmembrane protein, putative [Medicago truncatula]